ncbi:MAG: thiamine phosphate synthase [Candidatus Azobacteroides sp.]|nr:thiamine phosphate synthase [Candidatus Azobacteroides sp.]
MKLIVVSPEVFLKDESSVLNRLFEEGLEILHVRKPGSKKADVEKLLQKIDPEYHSRIVLHDHFSLTDQYNLKGVHLNRRNPVFIGRPGLSRSRSCHSFSELEQCEGWDYLFLSPIFDSISKTGYVSGFSAEELRDASNKQIIHSKIIALGGIAGSNIAGLKTYGFGGAAVLGALWNDFQKDGDLEKMIETYNELNIKMNEMTLSIITKNAGNVKP